MLKITCKLVVEEFTRRNVPFELVDADLSLLRYQKPDGTWHWLRSSLTDMVPATASCIADNKLLSETVARRCGLPVPASSGYQDEQSMRDFMMKYRPIVVKPNDGGHGNGVTLGVEDEASLQRAIDHARAFSDVFILQQQVSGHDYRVLVINYAVAACSQRIPAAVVGDGHSTIAELIDFENSHNPARGDNNTAALNYIDIEAARFFLGERYDKEVPKKDAYVQVIGVSNVSAGGKGMDATDTIPSLLKDQAITLARELSMPLCAVDFMYDPESGNHYFLEVNATPSFGHHEYPHEGSPRHVTQPFVDWLLQ